jgi:hypothetical protein
MHRPLMAMTAALALLVGLARPALAWNRAGHMVTGAIAYRTLERDDPQALKQVVALLERHPWATAQWKDRLAALAPEDRGLLLFMLAARWADDARKTPYDRPTWHYVDFPFRPLGQPDSVAIVPPPEPNALTAFRENRAILASDSATAGDQAVALCWLFHLVGDVHQPLHTVSLFTTDYPAPDGDRGGTLFNIRATPDAETISLHRFWDDLILGSEGFQEVRNRATLLMGRPEHRRDRFPELAEPSFEQWVRSEGVNLAREVVYRGGKLEGSTDRDHGAVLPPDYAAMVQPVAYRRAVLASYRLADLLGVVFRSRAADPSAR